MNGLIMTNGYSSFCKFERENFGNFPTIRQYFIPPMFSAIWYLLVKILLPYKGTYILDKLHPVDQLRRVLECCRGVVGEAVDGFCRLFKVLIPATTIYAVIMHICMCKHCVLAYVTLCVLCYGNKCMCLSYHSKSRCVRCA